MGVPPEVLRIIFLTLIATYNEFCVCSRTGLCSVWWNFVFLFEFLTPFTLGCGGGGGGPNFLISNSFLTIISVPDVPRGGIQVLFEHQKQ